MSTALVRHALSISQTFRDDDKLLTLFVWERQGLKLNVEQRTAFMGVSSMDFIARRRREMRETYPESEAAFERRHKHYLTEKERYSK